MEKYRCPGCAGDMQFDPAAGLLKCPRCGHTQAPPETAAAPAPGAHPLDEFLAKTGTDHLSAMSQQALQVNCEGCGSVVSFQPPEVAGACPFCGSNIVAQPQAADPLIAPDGVLPAKVSKTDAQAEVRRWIESRWFAPGGLRYLCRGASSAKSRLSLQSTFERIDTHQPALPDAEAAGNFTAHRRIVGRIF